MPRERKVLDRTSFLRLLARAHSLLSDCEDEAWDHDTEVACLLMQSVRSLEIAVDKLGGEAE